MIKGDKLTFWINVTPLFLSLFITIFVLFSGNVLPPKLPLFYSLPWGDSQLVENKQLLILPASMVLIALLNLILSWQLHSSQIFFKRILLSTSILISSILIITFIEILLIFA